MTGRISSIGDRLKAVRTHLAVSQAEMAGKIGISSRSLQNYETNKRAPRAEDLVPLGGLGVDLNWLLTGHGEMWQAGATTPPNQAEADQLIDSIESRLNALGEVELPFPMELVKVRPDLLEIHDRLQAISANEALPEDARGQADTMLRLAFGDRAAYDRQEARFDEVTLALKDARRQIAEAAKAAGFALPPLIEQQMLAMLFHSKMEKQVAQADLTMLVDAIRATMEEQKR